MREFLKKIKLIDNFTTTLQLSRQDFIKRLSQITDKGNTNAFSDPFEAFSSSKSEFKGEINHNGFKLRRRRKLFERTSNIAVATGNVKEENGQLTIQTEIYGFTNFMYVFYGFLILFYSVFIICFISDNKIPFFVFPFLIFHAALMTLIPYFLMRSSVKKMKYELEREFFYLTKSNG